MIITIDVARQILHRLTVIVGLAQRGEITEEQTMKALSKQRRILEENFDEETAKYVNACMATHQTE